jgi:hypothetical protein
MQHGMGDPARVDAKFDTCTTERHGAETVR